MQLKNGFENVYKISRTYSLWAWILPQLIVRAHCTTTTTKLNNSEKNNWAFFMNVFIFVFRVTKDFSVLLLLFWRLQFLIHETNANVNTNGCACECEYSLWHLYLYSLLTRWSLVWSMGQFCCSSPSGGCWGRGRGWLRCRLHSLIPQIGGRSSWRVCECVCCWLWWWSTWNTQFVCFSCPTISKVCTKAQQEG